MPRSVFKRPRMQVAESEDKEDRQSELSFMARCIEAARGQPYNPMRFICFVFPALRRTSGHIAVSRRAQNARPDTLHC